MSKNMLAQVLHYHDKKFPPPKFQERDLFLVLVMLHRYHRHSMLLPVIIQCGMY